MEADAEAGQAEDAPIVEQGTEGVRMMTGAAPLAGAGMWLCARRTPRSQSGGTTSRPSGSSAACLRCLNPCMRPSGCTGLWRPATSGLVGGPQSCAVPSRRRERPVRTRSRSAQLRRRERCRPGSAGGYPPTAIASGQASTDRS
jgi:hypothetical protein